MTKKGHLVVGVYYRLLDQGEPADVALLEIQEVSCLHALVLVEDFNHTDILGKQHSNLQAIRKTPLDH